MKNYFWDLFEHTGNIEAYLAYKDIEAVRHNRENGGINEHSKSQGNNY